MARIIIPTPLRQFAGGNDSVDVEASNVGEALAKLVEAHPAIEQNLFNSEGKLRSFVNIYVSDEDIRYLDKEATAVGEDDTISIVPSIAGGSANGLPELSNAEIMRYSRHLILPEVGLEGQRKLKGGARFDGRHRRSGGPRWGFIWPRPASARSASSISMSWTRPTCSGR